MTQRLDAEKALLTVIDVQGALAEAMAGKEELFLNLEKLIRGFKALGAPVIWTEQVPHKLGPTIARLAQLMDGAAPLAKSCFSCAQDEAFIQTLSSSGKAQVLICGIEAHVCALQTALDLIDLRYEVFIAADAVSSRDRRNARLAIKRMRGAGAQIVSVEMALFEMMKTANHSQFRQIQKIVK